MNNKILALKYRPKFFNEVIGQDFCVQSLANSINLNKLHNAYLFSGTRGVGKTTIARIFAKSLLCKEGISESPCGKCESCLAIDNNNNLDLIEIDAASRTKVEDTRTLMENVQYAPTSSRFKIYLIDEVHMLSTKSFNALLKTIEEPPAHVKFLLATTDPDKLPETVISRCLHFKLESITNDTLSNHIKKTLEKENVKFEAEVPDMIAECARGSARDSMSILEQCISYANENLTTDKISHLLGIIDEKIIDEIVRNLLIKRLDNITDLMATNEIHDYSKLLDRITERIFQISISRQTNKNAYNLPELFLECVIKLEDLQLWYSLLLQAKEDFYSAPSKADHLLMIFLRIMLFTEYPNSDDIKPILEETTSIDRIKKEETTGEDKIKKKDELFNDIGNKELNISFESWAAFVNAQDLKGLMLDLAQNSFIEVTTDSAILLVDISKKNMYPKKCVADFLNLLCKHFGIDVDVLIEHTEQVSTIYKKSVDENIKSKEDMYDSIKDNNIIKDIEDIFDAKIDKDNISKL